MNRIRAINPPELFDGPSAGISQAIRVGDTIYCSGQVAFGATLEEQALGAFQNVKTLLEAAGATMADIVKMTVYTTDPDCWPKTQAIRDEFLKAPHPAATLPVVKALASPRLMIEVDVIAVVGSGQTA